MNTLSDMKTGMNLAGRVTPVRAVPLTPKTGNGAHGVTRPTAMLAVSICALALLLTAASAHAVSYSFSWNSGFAASGAIPDGNVTGWSDTRVLGSIAENTILDVDVTIQLTGGWNGDLYGYLTHSSGFSVLLNRAGRTSTSAFGYSDAGLNVRFDDAAPNGDIHLYQAVSGFATTIGDGSGWAPDGRAVNPLTALNTDPRTAMLSSFNGLDPNGSWTLFLADLSGGEVSTVANWGLNIQAETRAVGVPDAGATLPMLGMAFAGMAWFARRRARSA